MKNFLLAWQFLTRITLSSKVTFTEKELAGSLIWFPAVGLGLGLMLAGLNWALRTWLPEIVVDILVLWSLIYLTRGLHLDGFMDVADGLYAGCEPQKALEIMHDSHVGGMAVVAVTGLLLVKVFALNALSGQPKYLALLLMPMLGRWGMAYAACKYKYVSTPGSKGTGRIFVERNGLYQFLAASILPVMFTVSLMQLTGAYLAGLAFLGSAAFSFHLNRRLGGVNGDCLGAVGEVTEIFALIFMLVLIQ